MTSIAYSPISIQTAEHSSPLPPPWFGEVVLIVGHLRKQGVLNTITQRVRFARRRFGRYEVIDFVAVLFGYAISGERTLEAFYQAVQPWEKPFMALFGRERLPHRSTLSRFLAALDQAPVEVLRTLFLARPDRSAGFEKEEQAGGLWDRQGRHWLVFDVDGTLTSPARLIFHLHNAGWARSAFQATRGASGVKPFGPGPLCSRPIRINGSARFREHRAQAMVITEESCGRRSR